MSRLIVLDAGPLAIIAKARGKPDGDRARAWLAALDSAGHAVAVPAIADYEVRRELLRCGATAGIIRLDRVRDDLPYLSISDTTLDLAAQLWADTRRAGMPTADPKALDGDAILAAQAILSASSHGSDAEPIFATTNPGHLARFVRAEAWDSILP